MIDIEMVGLGALEQHDLSGIERFVEQHADVDDVRSDPLRMGDQVVGDLRRIDHPPVVDLDQQVVLLLEGGFDLLAEDRLVEQVLNPQTDPIDLVRVRGPTPRPVVPIRALPRKRSVTLSITWW